MTSKTCLLLVLLAGVVLCKLVYSASVEDFGVDGGYYADVAAHVRDGEGISTRISLYHHGYRSFPHPSPIYPLWPAVLGLTARIVPLDVAAVWLPSLLWLVTVVLAGDWARRLSPIPLLPGRLPALDTGHAFALVFALHLGFFRFTSMPYTEGLAYALLFAALLRFDGLWSRPSLRAGAELGLWLAVLLLARSQFVVVSMAAAGAFGVRLLTGPGRRAMALAGLACAATFTLAIAPHLVHLARIAPETPLHVAALRFEMARSNSLLTPMDVLTGTRGPLALVLDRLSGVPIAFSPRSPFAYMREFHGFQWSLPAALPFAIAALVRRGSVRAALDRRSTWAKGVGSR